MPKTKRKEEWGQVDEAIRQYIKTRKSRVESFLEKNFSLEASFRNHQQTILNDFLRASLNALLAFPILGVNKLTQWFGNLGAHGMETAFRRIPPGLTTEYQKNLEFIIYSELLELPYTKGKMECTKDALNLNSLATNRELKMRMNVLLHDFFSSRAAISDLGAFLTTFLFGYVNFQDGSLSLFGIADKMARAVATRRAEQGFLFGRRLGHAYYHLFPVHPSNGQIAFACFLLLVILGIVGTALSIVTDPILWKMGLQRNKLHRLLDEIQKSLLETSRKDYEMTRPGK